jgi:hypothetical protein
VSYTFNFLKESVFFKRIKSLRTSQNLNNVII